ncbi:RecE family exodeoxyribonuclease [Salmonella enterica]
MSSKPIFLIRKAKKSSGQPDAVLRSDCDFETACATLDYQIIKSGRKLKDYFKAVATRFPVVDDLPPEGEVDFTWCERYQLSEDNMTWECISGATADTTEEQAADDAAAPQDNQNAAEDDCPACEVPVATLPLPQRLLHIFTYAAIDRKYLHHATRAQRRHITVLEMDTDNSYVQNLLMGIRDIPDIDKLDNPSMLRLTDALKAVFSVTEKPQPYEFKNFTTSWLETHHIDRGLLVKEWRKGNRVSRINRTPSGANAGGGILTDRGEGFVHDEASLARDTATGVLARSMDIDIYHMHPAHAKRVDEIVAENKPPFSVFFDAFRKMPGALDYSRAIVVASVKEAPIGIEALPHKVLEYLNRVLTETDHANPEPLIVDIACGRSSMPMPQQENKEDEKNHDEEKPQPSGAMADEQATAETMEPDATEHHQDTQSVDAQSQVEVEYQKKRAALHEARANIPPKNIPVPEQISASDEGEKTEVQTKNDEKKPEEINPQETNGDTVRENMAGDQPGYGRDKTGKTTDTVETGATCPSYFEPGRYEDVPNDIYHAANGISSSQVKDARISLMYYHGRHITGTIPREESEALLRGRLIHSFVLEPEKFSQEYAIPVAMPAHVISTTAQLIGIIKEYNAGLPALMTPDELKAWIDDYNRTLTPPLLLGASAEETAQLYMSLPPEFQRIEEGQKQTATAMKACIKEYNASLPPLLKTSGSREQLLDQIATVAPELADAERAKFVPYNISGTKEQLTEIVRDIRPDIVTAEDWQKQQQEVAAGRTMITAEMYKQVVGIHAALQGNPDASYLLNHPARKSEVSYFGLDEETGLEIRVRPDIEIRLPHESICADLKSVSLGYVRQERLKERLHREITERGYHISAAMYCDVANLDKFFWIFVNKDEGYHWVAVVEASTELLELGRMEYRRTLGQINEAMETDHWPAPITERYTDELNDYDLRRLEVLSI